MSIEIKRTRLDWARYFATTYRRALLKVDPKACAQLDKRAREVGQEWVAPEPIAPKVAAHMVRQILAPADIARVAGVPVGTIYSWISRGLLTAPEGAKGKYLVRDALELDARRKVRRLDTA
jgi:hypothetical protein